MRAISSKLTGAQHASKPLELDAEGVAFESSSFYVTPGSHGEPHRDNRKKEAASNAKAEAAQQIFRVTLDPSRVDMKSASSFRGFRDQAIRGSCRHPAASGWSTIIASTESLEDNGLAIKGKAISDRHLYVRMHDHILGTDAAVFVAYHVSRFSTGNRPASKLQKLRLGKDTLGNPRGVHVIAGYTNSFLVLAGPVNDPPKKRKIQRGDYSICPLDGDGVLERVRHHRYHGKTVKPEALFLSIDGDARRARVLILFDVPKEGAPRRLRSRTGEVTMI